VVRTDGDPGAHDLDGLGAVPFQRMPDLTAEQYDYAEAGRLIAEAVFNPRFDYLLDPGTVDEWRPQWDHATFLPYTENERSALLDAIGGVR
jgi:hypothetical protein